MDWGHVFESLNKLDVGVSERVLLLSRDEMSMLVASYADIKRCVDGAYAELLQSSKAYN
jgi:PAB-dependent poly(A)-specific ribonuclease subunit 3